jgi:plastocyanin
MNRTTRVAAVAATTLLAFSGLAACGSSDSSGASSSSSSSTASSPSASPTSAAASPTASASASGGSSSAKTAMITIKEYKYSGASSVAPGTKISVKNEDSEAHTVTADSGSKFNVTITPGKTKTFTAPSSAGTYKFHCTYHSNMHGTLKVS